MNELFQQATDVLDQKYTPGVHTVAATLRTTGGEVFTAVNIDHFLGFVCAETAALTIAINHGAYDFESVGSVMKDSNGKTVVADMCGKCRQIFHDYAPGIMVLTSSEGAVAIEQLLPGAFSKQQQKITNSLGGKSL